jgi:hypothetical protein
VFNIVGEIVVKVLLPVLSVGLISVATAASAVCGPPIYSSPTEFHPTIMLGLSYVLGDGATDGQLGVTAKVLSSNKANSFVLGGGVSYFPGADVPFGVDLVGGYAATNFAALAGYDLVQRAPTFSAGLVPTAEDEFVPCTLPSDARLKRDIQLVRMGRDGLRFYAFKYLWSDETYVGLMAQDLLADPQRKDAVVTMENGFYGVNYGALGLRMATLSSWQRYAMDAVVVH